ncbi:hypothetical protein EXU57_06890 [Segetibacter sp. 3557_3]|uniref:LamG-like jellyroll fold domain-containing protein n=1 Tax=Segetibacter sp. 3557_3 TaxID=2547429 RepID=UPI00105916EF|nr:LamG-like jellyroll fold domain-containing protein [Segetibacter sp. 3557_3]TDH27310.1 hypothetical protein EXU57_06890 [Segetibacter sp. 3557_3]
MKSTLQVLLLLVLLGSITPLAAQPYRATWWSGYNSNTQVFPLNGSISSPYFTTSQLNYSGLTRYDDNRTIWVNPNTSATLNTATAPYLSYTLNTNATIRFDRFVLSGLAILGNSKLQLRWSVDGYASSLGEFSNNGSSYTLTSVSLPTTSIAAGSIVFRVYFYAASGSAMVFNSHTGPYPSIDGTPTSYGQNGANVSVWYTSPDPTPACTGTPTPGTSTVSPASGNIVTNQSAALSLAGYTSGVSGITIQWQSSSIMNGTYTDIAGATGANYNTGTIINPGATYYRARVTCTATGLSSFSNVITVTATNMPAPGNAINFDGVNDFINCGNSAVVAPANMKTMECWVRFNGFGDQEIISRSIISYGVELLIYGGNLSFFCMRDGSNTSYISYPASNLQTNTWYHLAATWNGTRETMRLYVNGDPVGTRTDIGNVNTGIPYNAAVNLRIGMWNDAPARYLNGAVDEVRIWDVQRTQAELQSAMYNVVAPSTSGLKAYYRFDQGTASGANTALSTAFDATPNALHGTLTNFTLTGATSNWVESYAMVVPATSAPATVGSGSFLAQWTAPAVGIVERYLLDVSTSPTFSSFVAGYNGADVGTATSFTVTNLLPSTTYYYRVRAQKASVSGQGINSNTSSATTVAQTPPGNALHYSGVSKAVVSSVSPVLNFATGTVECWVKRDALNGQNALLVGVRNDPNGSRFSVHMGDNLIGLWNGSVWSPVTMPTSFVPGKWYHIAVVIKAATSDVYVNGVFIGSTTNGMGTATGLPLIIGGGSATATGEVLNGAIDEVRVWNTQRTAAQIATARLDTVPASTAGLVAYYKFDQGIASGNNTGQTVAYDATVNALNGTLSGFGLTGSTSNWIESYAMAVPTTTPATLLTTNAMTANWSAPLRGTVEKYLIDVSTNANFTSFVAGYNGKDVGLATSTPVTGLSPNTTYYIRVRAEKSSVTGQGSFSNTITATTCPAMLVPSVSIAANPSGVIASGTTVQFTATPTNGGSSPYFDWILNGSVVQSGASNTYVTATLQNGDVIEVELTSNAQCLSQPSAGSNAITVTVTNVYTWNSGNGNWNTSANWTPNVVPSGTSADVVIPTGTPTVTSPISIGSLNIATGAGLSLAANLGVAGNLAGGNSSDVLISGTGNIVLNGTSPQLISGNTTVTNLQIDNPAGASIVQGSTVNLTGVFTPVAGALNTNGGLVLKSTATGIATVAAGTGNYISGDVTVERYFPAKRAWRFVTAPVSNSGSVFANWQNNGSVIPNTGIEIWRPTGGNGFATGGNGTSIQRFDENANAWVNLNNTTASPVSDNDGGGANTVADNRSYSLFVSGHYGSGNINEATGASATTMRTRGRLQSGTQTFSYNNIAADHFVLVGNPYASPVDFATIGKTNIKNGFWAWDPQRSGTTLGGYVTVSWDNQTSSYDIDYLPSHTAQTNIIQNGQAVLVQVQNSGSNTAITFNENSKASSGTNTNNLFRGTEAARQMRVVLNRFAANTAVAVDGVLAKFGKGYAAEAGPDDAVKMYNYDENFSLTRSGLRLSIERRPQIVTTDTLFLNIDAIKANNNYGFSILPEAFDNPLLSAYLVDNYLVKETALSLTNNTEIRFTVDANTASANPRRFMIVFRTGSALPITFKGIKAWQSNQGIQVEWNVESETNISHYAVERSANAIDYMQLGTVSARNQNKVEVYTLFDAIPLQGANYYRIRIVEHDGSARYSAVAKVQSGKANPAFTVSPNPVQNKQANVHLANMPKGVYTLAVYNQGGQQVYVREVQHDGIAKVLVVFLPKNTGAGNYHFVLTGGLNKQSTFTQNVIVQ